MNDKEQVTMLRFQNKQLTAQLKWFEQTYGHKARDTEGCVFLPSAGYALEKKVNAHVGFGPRMAKQLGSKIGTFMLKNDSFWGNLLSKPLRFRISSF